MHEAKVLLILAPNHLTASHIQEAQVLMHSASSPTTCYIHVVIARLCFWQFWCNSAVKQQDGAKRTQTPSLVEADGPKKTFKDFLHSGTQALSPPYMRCRKPFVERSLLQAASMSAICPWPRGFVYLMARPGGLCEMRTDLDLTWDGLLEDAGTCLGATTQVTTLAYRLVCFPSASSTATTVNVS